MELRKGIIGTARSAIVFIPFPVFFTIRKRSSIYKELEKQESQKKGENDNQCRDQIRTLIKKHGLLNIVGATGSAVMFSMIQTAIENGLDPCRYLTWLMKTANNADLTNPAAVQRLLPWNAAKECRTK